MHGSVIISGVTNRFGKKKFIIICCLSSSIFLLTGYSNTSIGQGEINVPQISKDTFLETQPNTSTNAIQKIAYSDILGSATRNQYNNTNEQFVTVLAPRTEDSFYSGVITFTASEPVKIEIQHSLKLDNATFDNKEIQKTIKYINNKPVLASTLVPNYPNNSFSSSITFTGKALEFSYEKPFVVTYTVNAVTDYYNDIRSESTDITPIESLEPPINYQASSGTLLTAAIPYLSNDILQELPFSDLAVEDLSIIIGKVPVDKATIILSKLPEDKRQEILSKIPQDKRQEILNN